MRVGNHIPYKKSKWPTSDRPFIHLECFTLPFSFPCGSCGLFLSCTYLEVSLYQQELNISWNLYPHWKFGWNWLSTNFKRLKCCLLQSLLATVVQIKEEPLITPELNKLFDFSCLLHGRKRFCSADLPLDKECGPQLEERSLDSRGRCCKLHSLGLELQGGNVGLLRCGLAVDLSFSSGTEECKTNQGGLFTAQEDLEAPKDFCAEICTGSKQNCCSGLLGWYWWGFQLLFCLVHTDAGGCS